MRRLPIRLAAIPGESLDSWMAAYASRLTVPVGHLAAAVGAEPAFAQQRPLSIALGRGIDTLLLAQATGVAPKELESLWRPLDRYVELVHRRLGNSWVARAVRPMAWSRFCPSCLAESGGRWLAAWRLPWCLACPAHTSLLASACLACGRRQRERQFSDELHQQTSACSLPRRGAAGSGDHRCGSDLTTASAGPAPAPLLRFLDELAPLIDLGADEATLVRSLDRLCDQLTVARLLGLDPAALRGSSADDVTSAAANLTRAAEVLSERGGAYLNQLATRDVRCRPHSLPRPWCLASPELASRILTVRDPQLRPTDRLRWRTTTTGRRPQDDPAELGRHVPDGLWADWSLRLCPPQALDFASFRAAGAVALRLPGSSAPLEALCSHRGEGASFARKVSRVLQVVAAAEGGPAVLRALTQLSDGLRSEGSPIDYGRRRKLAADAILIEREDWARVCAAAGIPTGGVLRLNQSRLWLWETLTGGLPHDAPATLRPSSAGLGAYHSFVLRLPARALALLDAHARRVLDENGCADEPLLWSPPIHWTDVVEELPGCDPDSLDHTKVTALLWRNLPPRDVAATLGTTIDHVRVVARRHPWFARSPRVPNQRTPLPDELGGDGLRALVVDQRRTLRSLADEFGVSRQAVRHALEREDIPVPPAYSHPTYDIDPAWLRAQYVDRCRTLPDIAAEMGAAPTTVARLARQHGIVLRGRGDASHAASMSAPEHLPQPLAKALLGQGGILRVRRFQVFARARSLGHGGRLLGVGQTVLLTQLTKLEEACGGGLIVRSPRGVAAQQLTALGRRLLAQADDHLGLNPEAPPVLPEPLAAALSRRDADRRIGRFRVAASKASIAAGAVDLGIDLYTLDGTIRCLEAAVGGLLLCRSSPRQPHRVTTLGRRLLRQADEHLATSE